VDCAWILFDVDIAKISTLFGGTRNEFVEVKVNVPEVVELLKYIPASALTLTYFVPDNGVAAAADDREYCTVAAFVAG
jgi:hypothetical protein